MTDPLTAGAIATLAFTVAVEKLAESLTEGALAQVTEKLASLKSFIWNKLRGNAKVEAALTKAEAGSKEDISRVSAYLTVAMDEDEAFAEQIRSLAQEIQQHITIGEIKAEQVQNNYGGTNFQTTVKEGGKVYQAESITIHER